MLLEAISSIHSSKTIKTHPVSSTPSLPETVTASRAGLRRLRTETRTSHVEDIATTSTSTDRLIEQLAIELSQAFQEHRYEDAIRILDTIERMPIEELEIPAEFHPLFIGALDELKAYCAAMLNRSGDALLIHSEAMEKIQALRPMLDEMFGSSLNVLWDRLAVHEGLFLLLNGQEAEAIQELQKAGTIQDPSIIMLLAAIQKKLGVQIIQLTPTESTDAESLFYAGRYEEALKELDSASECSDCNRYLRGACYAMLDRTDEALALFEPATDAGLVLMRNTIQLMRGNFKAAQETPDLQPIQQMGLYHITAIPLNLAIHWIENYSAVN